MLEGLEITEVSSRKVFNQTVTHRIDPEYFQSNHLEDEQLLNSRADSFVTMSSIGLTVNASAFYPSIEAHYGAGSFPFLRVADVNTYISYETCETIPESLCSQYPTLAKVNPGDIVFTKGGSIARIGLVTSSAAVSRDLIFLDTSKKPVEDQIFLFLYFQTGFFNRALVRSSSQTAQPHLTITLVRELKILAASEKLKGALLLVAEAAFKLRERSLSLLTDAETILLEAMNLSTWSPKETLSYEKNSSSVFAIGRLDSQFFAPRVSELMEQLRQGGLTIGDAAPARHERFKPDNTGIFNYIEIGGLGTDGTAASESLPQREAPSRATQYVRAGDIITSTVRPIRRLSALISPEQDGDVCSSGFVVLQPRGINAETLLTYLRLPLVCELMDLHTSATMYPAISESDLLRLPIPAIPANVQETIAAAIQQAADSRNTATNLLNAAKHAVEIAIEYSEADALAWLEAYN